MAAKLKQGIQSTALIFSFLFLLTWPLLALYLQLLAQQ